MMCFMFYVLTCGWLSVYRDLPQYAESFSCEIHSSKSKRLPNFGKENSLGENEGRGCQCPHTLTFHTVHTLVPLTLHTV